MAIMHHEIASKGSSGEVINTTSPVSDVAHNKCLDASKSLWKRDFIKEYQQQIASLCLPLKNIGDRQGIHE
jgi:hypothetical protein